MAMRVDLGFLKFHEVGHPLIFVRDISCPVYAIQRATLAASVKNILQKNNLNYLGNNSKLYLYGHPSLNSTENKKIILATIKYIKESLRFSN